MNMRCLRGQTPFCVAASAPRWKPLQLLTSAYFAVAHLDRGFAGNSLMHLVGWHHCAGDDATATASALQSWRPLTHSVSAQLATFAADA